MKNYKLVVTVPHSHADLVRNAIGDAGGGKMGNYAFCSFSVRGIGRFTPLPGAQPTIGEVGKPEAVEEERIECVVNEEVVDAVIVAMKEAHPYEEVAYDLFLLESR